MPFKFGDDRFKGFTLAEGQILPFPIYFEGRPYNTHTIVWGVITAGGNDSSIVSASSVSIFFNNTITYDRCT